MDGFGPAVPRTRPLSIGSTCPGNEIKCRRQLAPALLFRPPQRKDAGIPFLFNPHAARMAVSRTLAPALAVVTLAVSMQVQPIFPGAPSSFAVTMPFAAAVRRKPERR